HKHPPSGEFGIGRGNTPPKLGGGVAPRSASPAGRSLNRRAGVVPKGTSPLASLASPPDLGGELLGPISKLLLALFPNHTVRVSLVFLADKFQKFSIGLQGQIHIHRPRFRVRRWIVDCHLQIHVSKVSAPESFG